MMRASMLIGHKAAFSRTEKENFATPLNFSNTAMEVPPVLFITMQSITLVAAETQTLH